MATEEKEWGYSEVGDEEPESKEPTMEKASIIELERTYWKKKIRLIDIITERITGEKSTSPPKEKPEKKSEEES